MNQPHRFFLFCHCMLIVGITALVRADTLPAAGQGAIAENLEELWVGFDPRREPLAVETLQECEIDGVVLRLIRYDVGTFRGQVSKVAGLFCYPVGARSIPGLLHLHGGGQSSSLEGVIADAKNGYASLSINWGGNALPVPALFHPSRVWKGPQTDWGKLDATHPPQRNAVNHFVGSLAPDAYTIDAVESPRNSNWFVVLMAARRALTFMEQQPQVDPARLGVYGHSMGGKLTINLAGIDPRVKAAVPSCGGCGEISVSLTELPGCMKTDISPLLERCVSDNAYIPRIKCPILWLSPTNDFHAIIEHMAWNWRDMPDAQLRLSITPHRNHTHDDAHGLTKHLFFEQHLKKNFVFPATPALAWETNHSTGEPLLRVKPDASQPIKAVKIYYSLDPHPLTRFWREAPATRQGDEWIGTAALMSIDQPLFAYADVTYETPTAFRAIAHPPGAGNSDVFAISSRMISISPSSGKAAGFRATDRPERMIDNGDRGWQDWQLSNWGHPPLWTATTAKLKDPKWLGPDGAKLVFEIRSTSDNILVIVIQTNAWGVYGNAIPKADYVVERELKASPDWQTVTVALNDLVAHDRKVERPLTDWQTVTGLQLTPTYQGLPDGRIPARSKAWQGPREIRNLRWEGGQYAVTPPAGSTLSAEEYQRDFNDAIDRSLEQEKNERAR